MECSNFDGLCKYWLKIGYNKQNIELFIGTADLWWELDGFLGNCTISHLICKQKEQLWLVHKIRKAEIAFPRDCICCYSKTSRLQQRGGIERERRWEQTRNSQITLVKKQLIMEKFRIFAGKSWTKKIISHLLRNELVLNSLDPMKYRLKSSQTT